MRNCVGTILGQKGSGKSTIAKLLMAKVPRAIIIDRMFEHDGVIFTDAGRALDYLAQNWRGHFRAVCRFRTDEAYSILLRYVTQTADRCPTLPFSILNDEADKMSSSTWIEPGLDYLYNYGRHYRINLLAVARGDTDLHRSIIGNSDFVIAMRMHKFSKEMREKFDDAERQSLRGMETLTPGTEPVKGTHYLLYPDTPDKSINPFGLWDASQMLISKPKTVTETTTAAPIELDTDDGTP